MIIQSTRSAGFWRLNKLKLTSDCGIIFYAYILKSLDKEWYYIGHTSNLKNRISIHNSGSEKSTKPYKPFILVHSEEYNTRSEAFKREQQIKRYRHGDAFKKLIGI